MGVCPPNPIIGEPVWGLLCLLHSWRGRVASYGILKEESFPQKDAAQTPCKRVLSIGAQAFGKNTFINRAFYVVNR